MKIRVDIRAVFQPAKNAKMASKPPGKLREAWVDALHSLRRNQPSGTGSQSSGLPNWKTIHFWLFMHPVCVNSHSDQHPGFSRKVTIPNVLNLILASCENVAEVQIQLENILSPSSASQVP